MRIQNCLFDIGGSLSLGTDQSISQEEILYLEKEINILNGSLPELENFILPGGSPASSLAQYARSVCRRCERSLVKVKEEIKIEDNKLVYLNRLSDLMFVIGRCLNRDAGIEENFWNQSYRRERYKSQSKVSPGSVFLPGAISQCPTILPLVIRGYETISSLDTSTNVSYCS